MFDEHEGEREERETDTPRGPLDPIAEAAALARQFEHHPLFPREDGSPETRDIQFVSFCRKRTGDAALQHCAEDFPARDIKSWGQVVEWWGGGEYKALAKDSKHRILSWFPSPGGEWLTFDGESKPFVLRNGKNYRAPAPTAAPPSADAPPSAPTPATAAPDDLRAMMTEVLRELRNPRAATPPPANESALVAMIQAQAAQAAATTQAQVAQTTAASQAQVAQANAASQANAQMMQTLLSVVAQRPAESAARPAEPTTLALQLIGAVQKLMPTPAAAPGLAEQIPVIKALRDLYQPAAAAAAPTNDLQPFVDIFGQVMAADAARTQAERAQTVSRPQEPPPARPPPPPRPRPALVHVPGVGVVEVVAPDVGARSFGDMSTEERAAAIRNDPALLRELGIGLPPSAAAPAAPVAAGAPAAPSPASPAFPVGPAVVEAVAVIPAVPDLEPTPVAMVAATPPLASSTVSLAPTAAPAEPPEPLTVPPEPATVAGPPPVSQEPPAAPPLATATPSEPPASAPEERTPIALPERMPITEPLHATEPDRELALDELKRLILLTHEERVAALRTLPGIGAMAEDVAHIFAALPPDELGAMMQQLDIDAIGALAARATGVAGG